MHIARQPSGAPAVRIVGGDAAGARSGAPADVHLPTATPTVTRCARRVWLDGFETRRPLQAVGVDLEWVEPRSDGFVRDFLTAPERA